MANVPNHPYVHKTGSGGTIYEFPLAAMEWGRQRLPIGGGGYFRLWPYPITRWGLRRLNKSRGLAVMYFHPYDLSDVPLKVQWPAGFTHQRILGARYTVFHNLGRGLMRRRFMRLISEFSFAPIKEILDHGIESSPLL